MNPHRITTFLACIGDLLLALATESLTGSIRLFVFSLRVQDYRRESSSAQVRAGSPKTEIAIAEILLYANHRRVTTR
jgi:hypothetical protein